MTISTEFRCTHFGGSTGLIRCGLFARPHEVHFLDNQEFWAPCGHRRCVHVAHDNRLSVSHDVVCVRSFYAATAGTFGLSIDVVFRYVSPLCRWPGQTRESIIAGLLLAAEREMATQVQRRAKAQR